MALSLSTATSRSASDCILLDDKLVWGVSAFSHPISILKFKVLKRGEGGVSLQLPSVPCNATFYIVRDSFYGGILGALSARVALFSEISNPQTSILPSPIQSK